MHYICACVCVIIYCFDLSETRKRMMATSLMVSYFDLFRLVLPTISLIDLKTIDWYIPVKHMADLG